MHTEPSALRTCDACVARVALLAVLLACGIASSAHAYCRLTTSAPTAGTTCATSGLPLFWSRHCISYTIVPRAAGTEPSLNAVRDVVDASFQSWADVACNGRPVGLSLMQTDPLGTCATPEYNENGPNANSIMFLSDWQTRGLPSQAFGLTLVWNDARTGKIIDADMQLNETLGPLAICKQSCADGSVDLQNIITHEAGHFLGLGHSSQDTACMWGKAAVGETSKRFLSRDDLAGLCAVYGAEATPTCATADYVPDHGFTAQCSVVAGTTTHRSCSIAAPGARTTPTPWAAITLIGLVACSRRRRPA